MMARLWVLAAMMMALAAAHPASTGGTTVKRKRPASKSTPIKRTAPPPSVDAEEDYEEEAAIITDEEDYDEEAAVIIDEDDEEATARPAPRTVASSGGKKSKKKPAAAASQAKSKKKKKKAKPPTTTITSWFSDSVAKLSEGVSAAAQTAKETLAAREAAAADAREAARAEAEEQHRRAQAARLRQLRKEVDELEAREAAAERGEEVEEGVSYSGTVNADFDAIDEPLSLSERGALIGSVLLSPAGMPGLLVGGAFGGAVGYVTERVDQARAYVASAYGERVETDRRNAAEIAAAHQELISLADVSVKCDDPEEAEELKQQMIEFLSQPCNQKCADCACNICKRNEAWASVNLGVLVCVNCAAVHRSLGVKTSRMKSVVFDRWDAQAARTLLAGGNDKARARYLARLPRGYAEPTPDCDEERRRAFIRTKYVRLRWAEPELRATAQARAVPAVREGATASAKRET